MYIPESKILKKYAHVLVNFALWGGKGIKPDDVVFLSIPESARPMLEPLIITVLESDAHFLLHYDPEGLQRTFFEHASEKQLQFVAKKYLLERINVCDHFLAMISTHDKYELKGIDSQKIMSRSKVFKFFMDARNKKENAGKLTWTLGLYGTEAMAKDAGLSLNDYWAQIIQACFLDYKDPIAKWHEVSHQIESIKDKLNKLSIEYLHIEGKDVDLKVKLGPKRTWMGGSGRNIPSFELFISPDCRGTEGKIKFNQPFYRYGNKVTGIELEFEKGRVVKAKAQENEKLLKDMIAVKNADKIGEFSLTDKRFSRITKFMGETLFDENMGGEFGNTHIALGMSYKDSYPGDPTKMSKKQWEKMGYNDSVIHTDVISTTDRIVTATLAHGKEMIMYKDGMFQI